MNIRERPEGTVIQEGPQVTSTAVADYFYFRRGNHILYVRFPKDDGPIESSDWQAPSGLDWIRACPAYSDQDYEFLKTAIEQSGKFEVLKAESGTSVYRILVTVGNESRPFDMSRELIVEAGIAIALN